MHIGVFILLLLSGERNFGVRLNKPYTATIPMDIPVFTGMMIIDYVYLTETSHRMPFTCYFYYCKFYYIVDRGCNVVEVREKHSEVALKPRLTL